MRVYFSLYLRHARRAALDSDPARETRETDGLWFCVPRCATRAIGDVRDA